MTLGGQEAQVALSVRAHHAEGQNSDMDHILPLLQMTALCEEAAAVVLWETQEKRLRCSSVAEWVAAVERLWAQREVVEEEGASLEGFVETEENGHRL